MEEFPQADYVSMIVTTLEKFLRVLSLKILSCYCTYHQV
jgi:hypothetical protein